MVSGVVVLGGRALLPPHGSSFQGEGVSVVDEPVQDGVGECRVSHDPVPVLDGELAGDQRGPAAVAVLEDFEEVTTLGVRERSEAEVIENEELGLGEAVEELGVGPIGAGERELAQQAREAVVAGREALATRAVAERAGQVALAGARCAGDEDALVIADPLTAGEPQHERALQTAGRPEVDVFDRGREVELGYLQEPREAPVVTDRDLPLEQEGQAVLEGEALDVGHSELLLEGVGHAGEAQLVELVEGLLGQHGRPPLAAAA